MEFMPNDKSVTSESAPLIQPVDCEEETDLFMVPLKRPSPRLSPHYRNVNTRTPPLSPAAMVLPRSIVGTSPRPGSEGLDINPFQSPAISGCTIKPDSPPMFTSPLIYPESGPINSIDATIATGYNSPPMSGMNTQAGSPPMMSPETQAGSPRESPRAESPSQEPTTQASGSTHGKPTTSTKASSLNDNIPAITHSKPAVDQTSKQPSQPPAIPPLSTAGPKPPPENLGLALSLPSSTLLAPPLASTHRKSPSASNWTVPDSPLERLSQRRATPDSAYDRARQMEVRRSEWKHVVYRFPVKGKDNWVIDADLTESSHARLADVARRSSEGFEFNGDYELAGIYRVLSLAHAKVMEEMREERRLGRDRGFQIGVGGGTGGGTGPGRVVRAT
ncbi:hypothetical protein VTI74DRAFT_5111 [Chaetomium olivicolor]